MPRCLPCGYNKEGLDVNKSADAFDEPRMAFDPPLASGDGTGRGIAGTAGASAAPQELTRMVLLGDSQAGVRG